VEKSSFSLEGKKEVRIYGNKENSFKKNNGKETSSKTISKKTCEEEKFSRVVSYYLVY